MAQDAIEQLQKKLRSLPDAIDDMMQRITEENRAVIEDKNIAQLEAGLDAEGSPIEPEYSPFTVAYKKSIGQPFDRVTLHDSGSFYKGMKANVFSNGFEMFNSDSKWGKLTEKYGDVAGLSEKSIEELREEVYLPGLQEDVKEFFDHG